MYVQGKKSDNGEIAGLSGDSRQSVNLKCLKFEYSLKVGLDKLFYCNLQLSFSNIFQRLICIFLLILSFQKISFACNLIENTPNVSKILIFQQSKGIQSFSVLVIMPDFEQTVWEITAGSPNTDDLWELAQVNVQDSMEVSI